MKSMRMTMLTTWSVWLPPPPDMDPPDMEIIITGAGPSGYGCKRSHAEGGEEIIIAVSREWDTKPTES